MTHTERDLRTWIRIAQLEAVLIGGLLVSLFTGCEKAEDRPSADSLPPAITPRGSLQAVAPPVVASSITRAVDTFPLADTALAVRVRTTSVTDSTWIVPPPLKPIGLPFGIWGTPADSICKTGYSGGIVPVREAVELVPMLDRAKRCRVRIVLAPPQGKLRDTKGLSVQAATTELGKWDWPNVCEYATDGTALGWNLGDDLTDTKWGAYTVRVRLLKWDSIMTFVRSKCPAGANMLRFRPSQIDDYPALKELDVLSLQYTGPRRHGPPAAILAAEVAIAKRLNVGLVVGLNLLDGGCGPASTGDCLPGIMGTSAKGTKPGLFQMSADEVKKYGEIMIADPYPCTFLGWGYGYGESFFGEAANRLALDSLSIKARQRTAGNCVQS